MNKYMVRLQEVNNKGVKTPKVLTEKLHELEQIEKLPVNEFTATRSQKLNEAIADILSTLEAKTPKDTRVNYGVVGVLDDSAMSKRALSYNRTVYAMQLLDIDYKNRRDAFARKLVNIEAKIPTAQTVEFNTLITAMSASEFENLPVVDETEEAEA